MKKLFKRSLALLCMLALLSCLLPTTISAAQTDTFVILSTTDMHGRCWDKNILNDGSVSNSMLNVATAVASVRSDYGTENVITIDNGDFYQGTPISSYQLTQQSLGQTTAPNPMALCMKEIGYDVSVLGNHEFNYGWDLMQAVRAYLADTAAGANKVDTLCANLYYDGTDGVHESGENVFTPYIIKTLESAQGEEIKLAIIGFENTDCPRWDVQDNYPGIVFTHPDNTHGAMVWEAEKYIAAAKADGADFIVVSYHSGLGSSVTPENIEFGKNSENQILSMIQNTEGIDMVIAGHDHSSSYSNNTYENKNGEDVLVVNGGGTALTKSVFKISATGGITCESSTNLALSGYSVDAALKAKMQTYVDAANTYVNQQCGQLTGTWSTNTNFYLQQSDTIDLINRAQISRGNHYLAEKYADADALDALYEATGLDHLTVDVSSTSVVVSNNYTARAGALSIKDIYKFYKYDNTLYIIPLTGQQIKDVLEYNAYNRLSVNTASGSAVFGTTGDSFTNPIFYGLDFQYDMSKPKNERIVNLEFSDGRSFDLTKTYAFAVNNYHLGNGPFADYSTNDAIWSQTDDLGGGVVQDLIAEYVKAETEANGGVAPAPSGWSIVYSAEIIPGEVSGDYIADRLTDPTTLETGDTIFIYHNAGNQLVTANASGARLAASADVTTSTTQLGTSEPAALFTVSKGADGYYRFLDADGKFMTSGATGNSLSMTATENEYSLWEFEATEGGFHIHNINAAYNNNKNQYLEFYSGFTTYGLGSGGGAYLFNIYQYVEDGDCTHATTELRNAKAATCTEPGYTGDTYCTVCGEKLATGTVIVALGHGATELRDAKAATCTVDGYTGDTYCTVCGEKTATGTAILATGHSWGVWELGLEATCKENGYEQRTCEKCAERGIRILEAGSNCPSSRYTDLDTNAWYHEYTDFAIAHKLMNGTSETEFGPGNSLTRGMVVTVLYRFENEPEMSSSSSFTDVPTDAYYARAVSWAQYNNIVNGITETTFEPNSNITREQLVTILYRYAAKYNTFKPAEAGALDGYLDDDAISNFAKEPMLWAITNGIVSGVTSITLEPGAEATRAQFAKIISIFVRTAIAD